jgi:hypothetical protein
MYEITINDDVYTMKSSKYYSQEILKNGIKEFVAYPYKKKKDKFIVSIFNFLMKPEIKTIEPSKIEPTKSQIETLNQLILDNLDLKKPSKPSKIIPPPPPQKKNINQVYKKF